MINFIEELPARADIELYELARVISKWRQETIITTPGFPVPDIIVDHDNSLARVILRYISGSEQCVTS